MTSADICYSRRYLRISSLLEHTIPLTVQKNNGVFGARWFLLHWSNNEKLKNAWRLTQCLQRMRQNTVEPIIISDAVYTGYGGHDKSPTVSRCLILFMTFTFMHLADAFIQSDLQCIQVIHFLSVCVFPGNRTHNLCAANTMLYHWATGTLNYIAVTYWHIVQMICHGHFVQSSVDRLLGYLPALFFTVIYLFIFG